MCRNDRSTRMMLRWRFDSERGSPTSRVDGGRPTPDSPNGSLIWACRCPRRPSGRSRAASRPGRSTWTRRRHSRAPSTARASKTSSSTRPTPDCGGPASGFQMAARSLVMDATALAVGFERTGKHRRALRTGSRPGGAGAGAPLAGTGRIRDRRGGHRLRRLADTPGRTRAGDEEDLEARIMAYVGDAPESLERMLRASYITPRKGGLL